MIAILGAGESGVGAARLARQQGERVWVSDAGQIGDRYRQQLVAEGIAFEEKGHSREQILAADLVVKSPGIPDTAAMVQEVLAAGIPVISEIEYAARICTGRLLAITGSNGKTTTTALIWHLLQTAGVDIRLGGNIGDSFAGQVAEAPSADYVLEVSSFQLDNIEQFRPSVALLLNITADHLDRYGYEMDRYAAAKFRITENQQAGDILITCHEDSETQRQLRQRSLAAEHWTFGLAPQPGSRAWVADGHLVVDGEALFPAAESQLLGPHNQRNMLAALLAVKAWGIDPARCVEGLRTFRPVPHRLEPVGSLRGVRYINDSKATNVDAVYYALQGLSGPLVWMVGGLDKGNDYSILQDMVAEKVKAIIVVGPNRAGFDRAFPGQVEAAADMASALDLAATKAQPGDTVLLSPACSSFDIFKNFEDRGNQFRALVQQRIQAESAQP
ncbi:MAG: UDP-N-acetylmuramoyl-L-alanine--D-glutamate ligase [Bacteroidetes bacterium]|nr:MAG: UDP-N-acetylmuramoyl-L-alanine--D-glutamate ligase [Bacteroidota bacterium]